MSNDLRNHRPYIHNVQECVIEYSYKNSPTKIEKGRSHWDYEEVEVVGKTKKKFIRKKIKMNLWSWYLVSGITLIGIVV